MSVNLLALLLVAGTVPAITTFALLFSFTSRWWETMIGRALFTSSWGFALLVDLSLAYRWLGDDYPGHDIVLLTVLSLIFLGGWLKLIALVHQKGWLHRNRRHEEN